MSQNVKKNYKYHRTSDKAVQVGSTGVSSDLNLSTGASVAYRNMPGTNNLAMSLQCNVSSIDKDRVRLLKPRHRVTLE